MIDHRRLSTLVLFTILVIGAIGTGPAAAQVCVEGVITADYQSGGPFAGMWRYTLEVSWSTGSHALSHLTFDLELENCPCICDGVHGFDVPAGSSDGEPEPCTLEYTAEFVCNGDPPIPEQSTPAIKWEPIPGDCEPGPTGSGVFWFYSVLGPGPSGSPAGDNAWVKFGQLNCSGIITGDLPICDGCPTPVEPTTWGRIKSTY